MKELTKIEETLLLAIWRLQDEAYGVTIKNQVKKVTNREYLYSTLYTTLEQLVRKGYIYKRYGEPTPERGGKRKIYFNLTEDGFLMLKNAFYNQQSVWSGITEESFEKGIQNERKS
jgi:DNA-binding PadR family transcriptional regulator